MKYIKAPFFVFAQTIWVLMGLNLVTAQNPIGTGLKFAETFEDFPRKEKNLRKWDSPTVADLDNDGWPDLILNDHGLGISVCWNNKGRFSLPYDVMMGDLHGVTVGDFNADGYQEIILSRGGGSGSNARNAKMYRITKEREFIALADFDIPLAFMRGRTVKFFDGDNDGDLDLVNFAFPSKEKKGKSESYIYENNSHRQLILKTKLPPSMGNGQKTLITDYNGDGVIDIVLYGHGSAKFHRGTGNFTFEEVAEKVFPFALTAVTSIIEIDFDNDGDFDLFLTRGQEFEIGETFYNKATKTWGFYTKRGNFQFEDLLVGDVLQMYNFQSQWPYNDAYFIGETGYPYDFPGETHSGKNIRLVNSNALGFPDKIKDEGGIHVGYVGNNRWRVAGNTWSPTTGTVKGVLDYRAYDHPEGLSDILLENRNGKFVDVSDKMGLQDKEHTVGVATADFDNNGFHDLLIINRGYMVFENKASLFLNQDGKRFVKVQNHGIKTNDIGSIGMAIEVLDYDLDGDVDVIVGNERGKWHLFENKSTKTNSVTIKVGSSPSGNTTALGALVFLNNCYGTQVKRVGNSGAQYSLSFNTNIHFGRGVCNKPSKVEVLWTNGEKAKKNITATDSIISMGNKNPE